MINIETAMFCEGVMSSTVDYAFILLSVSYVSVYKSCINICPNCFDFSSKFALSNMKILLLVYHLCILSFFQLALIDTTIASHSDSDSDFRSMCKFERTSEVQRECSGVLSLASKSKHGGNMISLLGEDINFQNGDWVQDSGGSRPLMPFDDSDMPRNYSSNNESLLKLASFWVMGIDFAHQSDNSLGLCGLMSIGLTRNRTLHYMPQRWTPWFHKSPGYSDQTIVFEGVYVESEENGGERIMCLLGTSLHPFNKAFSDYYGSWSRNENDYSCQSSFIKDDRLMLILRYPQNVTLTRRAVIGELRSLNDKSDFKYFDKVHISSHLGYSHNYEFDSEKLVSRACDMFPCQDGLIDDDIKVYGGSQFCKILPTYSDKFEIVSFSTCNDTKKSCNNFGPFMVGREKEGPYQMLDRYKLIMKNIRCTRGDNSNKFRTAKVSAVFRAVSPVEDHFSMGSRTGLSELSISSEGTWNSSNGRLCMVGCLGMETATGGCNSRICLYFPVTISVTQRSTLIGIISSIKKTGSEDFLIFKKELRPADLHDSYNVHSVKSQLSYRYSKMGFAASLMKRNQNFEWLALVKKLLLKYPAVEDRDNLTSLFHLSNKLSFSVGVLPLSTSNNQTDRTFISFEILSLAQMFGNHWPQKKDSSFQAKDGKSNASSTCPELDLPLNISGYLRFTGKQYIHISKLSVEGLYDQLTGKAYLIGCRYLPKTNHESKMDCSIEVKVEYSSNIILWLINPTAKVSVTSQRNKGDPLYFSPVSLSTAPIPYMDNNKLIIFRKNFEAVFRVLVVLASVACLANQLYFGQKKVDAFPFVSLVMLGIQSLGYALPLIMNTAVLFNWKEYLYPETRLYRARLSMKTEMLDYAVKFLLVIAFVLTLKLCQKVWESRVYAAKSLSLKRYPYESLIFLYTTMIHMVGFSVLHITQNIQEKSIEWVSELDKYSGLAQDLFLLPQILGNMVWQTKVKPLSKVYYIGFSALRFIIHGYDCMRDPVFSLYYHKYDSRTSSEFFSNSENCMIMIIVAVFAIVVHAQQKGWRVGKII